MRGRGEGGRHENKGSAIRNVELDQVSNVYACGCSWLFCTCTYL